MARVNGALFSLSASGSLAGAITYSRWKGIDYARQRVIPANPRTASQTEVRDVFKYIYDYYKRAPAIAREPWVAAARGRPLTAQNAILSANIANLQTETDVALFSFSGGALGGLPPTDITLTPGNDQITIACTAPSTPTGWTLVAMQAAAVPDQDPHDPIEAAPSAVEDETSAYSVVMSGLADGTLYRVGVWLKWITDTGNEAYSASVQGSATTT